MTGLYRLEPTRWSVGRSGAAELRASDDSLVEQGFVVLGGPLEGDRDVLHRVAATYASAVRERLAHDNWSRNGMLTVKSVEPWTPLLDSRVAPA